MPPLPVNCTDSYVGARAGDHHANPKRVGARQLLDMVERLHGGMSGVRRMYAALPESPRSKAFASPSAFEEKKAPPRAAHSSSRVLVARSGCLTGHCVGSSLRQAVPF
jgi:hypothetical protein